MSLTSNFLNFGSPRSDEANEDLRIDKREELYRTQGMGNAYTTLPGEKWTCATYWETIPGMDNMLLYLWIAKDISWTTSTWVPAWLFGMMSVFFSGMFFVRTVLDVNWAEIWHSAAQFLWVFGNFWWMIGDVHDVEFPKEKPIYDARQIACSHIMEGALALLAIWYLVIKPLRLLPDADAKTTRKYNTCELIPSIPYFKTWREYELFHIVLWLGKDYAWNVLNKPLWFIFTPFTLIASVDFIWTTAKEDHMIVDNIHYISTLLWVLGNMMWALGELFYANDDDPEQLFRGSRLANENCRWWASWILIFSYLPLLVLHCVWIPLSVSGKLDHTENDEGCDENDDNTHMPIRQHSESGSCGDSGDDIGSFCSRDSSPPAGYPWDGYGSEGASGKGDTGPQPFSQAPYSGAPAASPVPAVKPNPSDPSSCSSSSPSSASNVVNMNPMRTEEETVEMSPVQSDDSLTTKE